MIPLPKNVNTITVRDWNAMLSDYTASRTETVNKGHKYICVNKEGELRVFNNKDEIKGSGFNKLKFSEVVKQTVKVMARCEDDLEKLKAGKNIEILSQIKAKRQSRALLVASNMLKISTAAKSALKTSAAIAPYSKLINRTQLEKLGQCLLEGAEVVRSRQGAKGVYFFVTGTVRQVGVKFLQDPHKHLLADRLFQRMGFTTANYSPVPSEFAASEKVRALLQDKKTSFGLDMHQIGQLNLDLDKRQLTMMDYIKATSFNDIPAPDLPKLMNNEQFQHELGEMMLLDAFLGNTDRLNPKESNLGNFMVNAEQDKRILALIDHDFDISKENIEAIKKVVTSILKGDGIEARVKNIIEQRKFPCDVEKVVKAVREGVFAAAKQLLKEFPTNDSIKKFFEIEQHSGFIQPDAALIGLLLKHINDNL